ncbi:peptide ABC transporter substrate-binding protein [Sporosarcina thermotolerans]|uniref:Peptide ABC transporter substrate-binding protein n=1 Tax=Sporosarcina thermotolerans TaxID=633404 RepID=A0AAW9AAX1_9BACL|nr:peptide ABC transporter substrate-binding protein [Sporosarcina thermotolerans]MDW0118327.1 peptide ABC transporter substrate-binding protein [Sporosarcina thermotolerans]
MLKRKWSILLVLVLSFSMVLAACGDDKKAGKDSSKEPSKDELAADQTLNVNVREEPPSLHPGSATDTTSGAVLNQVFEGLMRVNQQGEVEEAMAESYEMSEDGLTYTFKIRKDAKWSNGDPVVAGDFEYAWKWVLNPANVDTDYAYQMYMIKGAEAAKEQGGSLDDIGITVKDDHTLVVELAQPTAYFIDLTAFHTFFPVNAKVVDGKSDWAQEKTDNYVTNGPFLLDSWKHKDKIVLKKNPEYWDADTVTLETINMFMIMDENTAKQMYDKGELDWLGSPTDSIPLAAISHYKKEGTLNISALAGTYYYAFNVEEAPFNNVNIRKAFAMAINRKGIVENITKAEQLPAMALVPPTIFEENAKGYFGDNDVNEAKKLLKKGLKELGLSELPTVKLSYNTSETHGAIAQAVQDMWKKNLGVSVELNNEEWGVYLDSMGAGNFQVGRMGWIADYNDAINFLEIFETVGGNNYTNWENKEYQALLKKSRTETDVAAREKILRDAEAIFMEELPLSPIYYYTNVWTNNDKVRNIEVSPLGVVQYKWGWIAAE